MRNYRGRTAQYQQPVATHVIEDNLEDKTLQIKSRLKILDQMEELSQYDPQIKMQLKKERVELGHQIRALTDKYGVSLFDVYGKIGGELLKNQLLQARDNQKARQQEGQDTDVVDLVDNDQYMQSLNFQKNKIPFDIYLEGHEGENPIRGEPIAVGLKEIPKDLKQPIRQGQVVVKPHARGQILSHPYKRQAGRVVPAQSEEQREAIKAKRHELNEAINERVAAQQSVEPQIQAQRLEQRQAHEQVIKRLKALAGKFQEKRVEAEEERRGEARRKSHLEAAKRIYSLAAPERPVFENWIGHVYEKRRADLMNPDIPLEDVKQQPEDVKQQPEYVKQQPEYVKQQPEDVKQQPEDVKQQPEDVKQQLEDVEAYMRRTFHFKKDSYYPSHAKFLAAFEHLIQHMRSDKHKPELIKGVTALEKAKKLTNQSYDKWKQVLYDAEMDYQEERHRSSKSRGRQQSQKEQIQSKGPPAQQPIQIQPVEKPKGPAKEVNGVKYSDISNLLEVAERQLQESAGKKVSRIDTERVSGVLNEIYKTNTVDKQKYDGLSAALTFALQDNNRENLEKIMQQVTALAVIAFAQQ